jgi:hypothetical protein
LQTQAMMMAMAMTAAAVRAQETAMTVAGALV